MEIFVEVSGSIVASIFRVIESNVPLKSAEIQNSHQSKFVEYMYSTFDCNFHTLLHSTIAYYNEQSYRLDAS